MKKLTAVCFIVSSCSLFIVACANNETIEDDAAKFLEHLELKFSRACYEDIVKLWDFQTNITAETEEISSDSAEGFAALQSSAQNEILDKFPNWRNFHHDDIRRQLFLFSTRGPANMDLARLKEQTRIGTQLQSAYASAKVCEYKSLDNQKKCRQVNLDPEISGVMKNSVDFDELEYYWRTWHDTKAKAVPLAKYKRFMDLKNEYANANNFSNMTDMIASLYDDSTADFSFLKFRAQVLDIWKQIKPYYDTLHAYVRMQLNQRPEYSDKLKKYQPYLPGNVLGNMWAQDWTGIADTTKPFKNVPSYDVTKALKKASYFSSSSSRLCASRLESIARKTQTRDHCINVILAVAKRQEKLEMMQLGMSKPWPKVLQVLTGSTKIRVEPVLNYFKPLITHLQEELDQMNKN